MKHIVGFSGGIDSQARLRMGRESLGLGGGVSEGAMITAITVLGREM